MLGPTGGNIAAPRSENAGLAGRAPQHASGGILLLELDTALVPLRPLQFSLRLDHLGLATVRLLAAGRRLG